MTEVYIKRYTETEGLPIKKGDYFTHLKGNGKYSFHDYNISINEYFESPEQVSFWKNNIDWWLEPIKVKRIIQ